MDGTGSDDPASFWGPQFGLFSASRFGSGEGHLISQGRRSPRSSDAGSTAPSSVPAKGVAWFKVDRLAVLRSWRMGSQGRTFQWLYRITPIYFSHFQGYLEGVPKPDL